jgi:tetratricopeptide (TPR) repeat protein
MVLTPVSPALAAPAEAEAAPAEAEAPAEGESPDVTEQAVAAFEAGEFDKAIELFNQAFEQDKDPNYLFNIGRVYEEKGDLRNAILHYEKFVNSAGVDLESRSFANDRLKVLRDIVAAEDAAKAEEEARKAEAEAAKNQPSEDEPAATVDAGPSEEELSRKRTRTIGFVLLGVGAATAAGGGVAGYMARSRHDDFQSESDPAQALDLQEQGTTLSSTADGLFIAGGVVAVAGLVMVLTTLDKGKGKDQKTARTNFQPHFGRSGAGLSVSHRF